MEYVVFETGGKQYKAEKGTVLEVENLIDAKDGVVYFDHVLLHVDDSGAKIGTPYVPNLKIKAKLVESLRGEKIRVARFKGKSRYRKVRGHRQSLSKIEIQEFVKSK